VPLEVTVRPAPGSEPAPGADRLCAAVAAAAPPFACGGTGAPIRVAVELSLGPPRYSRMVTERAFQRRAGTRQVPNPEWAAEDERVRDADDRVRRAEGEQRRLGERCEQTRQEAIGSRYARPHAVEWDCDRAEAASRERMRLESDAADARRRRDGVPPTLDEDVYETVPYREKLHRWTATFAARASGPDGAAVEVTPPDGVLVHEDLERPEIPDAGVPGDPYEDLPPGRFAELAVNALRGPLASLAREALLARARAREAACAGEGPAWSDAWLACRAEAAFWQGRPIEAELLRGPGATAPIGCR
jgi:hypothetical protein